MTDQKRTFIYVSLPDRVKKQLQKLADEQYMNLSVFIRTILVQYLKNQDKD